MNIIPEKRTVHSILENLTAVHRLHDNAYTFEYQGKDSEPHTYTLDELREVDTRLTSTIQFLWKREWLGTQDKPLQMQIVLILKRSYGIWINAIDAYRYNDDTSYWERWTELAYTEESKSFSIKMCTYNGHVLDDGVVVLYEPLGSIPLCMRRNELGRAFPGILNVYDMVEQLGYSKQKIAAYCQQYVFDARTPQIALPALPLFEQGHA